MCVQKDDNNGNTFKTDFDPKWPHGHMRKDRRAKAEILRTLGDGRHAVLLTDLVRGAQWVEMYRADGAPDDYPYVEHFLINAPAPKRTWDVVAVEWSDGRVYFLHAETWKPDDATIIGRWRLTEGEGMEEKNG